MPDETKTVSLSDPNYQAATLGVLRSVLDAYDREGSFQNGVSALLINLAMLLEREPGRTNKEIRERCELVGRTLNQQVKKMLREQYEQTGERQFDQLSAHLDQVAPTRQ